MSAAPIASTAGLGLQSVQEESRRASLRYKHTSAQIRGRIWGQPGRLHSQNHKIQLLGYIKLGKQGIPHTGWAGGCTSKKEKGLCHDTGSNKNDGGLDLQERVKREKHSLSWGNPSQGSPPHVCVCVCVPGNIVRAVDKSAPLVARDGLDRDRFISTMVTWLAGWRGHSAQRHSGSLPELLPWITRMKDFVQMPREMIALKKRLS